MTDLLIPADTSLPGRTDINEFVLDHGRLPRIGDEIPPWEYRGWLLWYCQLGHRHPQVVDRWSYYQRTVETGHLLEDAIPRITFLNAGSSDAVQMLRKTLDLVFAEIGSWSAFPALVDWIAWGMAVSSEKPPLSTTLNEQLYRHFDLGPLLMHPHDYLGALYAEGKGKWNPHAFFPTPHPIVECMTQVTMVDVIEALAVGAKLADGRDPRTATVCDPCVGSGRMLLHASNYSLCLYGCDIDPLCCRISAINGVLYAPWLAFPFRTSVVSVPTPPPPPAVLHIPDGPQQSPGTPAFRVDDNGQGLLFDLD